jgi:hypothetical protein
VGSNPTSSASTTSPFAERDDRWSELGPCPVGERGGVSLLQPVSQRLQLGGEQVPVDVQGDAGGRAGDMIASRAVMQVTTCVPRKLVIRFWVLRVTLARWWRR